ncbi:casein kinase I [Ceratobasidium sp. AG-Ba]|nr:casein kinase I [Ceratobasidium sp. AG-Ba]QRW14716.1 casein kinase I [Ceratobasidium sp. AG-Ba]
MQAEVSESSIWQYVHCSMCMVLFLPPNRPNPAPEVPFWVTDCGHVICNNHLKADQTCAACGTTNISCVPLQQRNMAPSILQWFVPVSESHEKLAIAANVQYNMLTELIEHYKRKYGAAKAVIMRLQGEVKSLQEQLELQQNHQPPSHFPLDQRPIHDSGYSSGHSSGSKRRRIDIESNYHFAQGGVSSPRSIHTPVVPSRLGAVSSARTPIGGAGSSMVNASESHRVSNAQAPGGGNLRSLNPEQYAYIPPSTPINGAASGQIIRHQVPSRSAAVMPPPVLHRRQVGSTSVLPAAPNLTTVQPGVEVGRPMNSTSNPVGQAFTGRFRPAGSAATPRPALQNNFEKRVAGGASSNRNSLFPNVGDGRRFVPGTPMGSKSSGTGQLFAARR